MDEGAERAMADGLEWLGRGGPARVPRRAARASRGGTSCAAATAAPTRGSSPACNAHRQCQRRSIAGAVRRAMMQGGGGGWWWACERARGRGGTCAAASCRRCRPRRRRCGRRKSRRRRLGGGSCGARMCGASFAWSRNNLSRARSCGSSQLRGKYWPATRQPPPAKDQPEISNREV